AMTGIPGAICSLDLGGRDGNAVAIVEDLIAGRRLAIHTDQIIRRRSLGQLLVKELLDGRAIGDIDVVSETRTVVVEEQNLHTKSPRKSGWWCIGKQTMW